MRSKYMPLVEQAARQYNIDPLILANLIQAESGWNPNAVSPAGAIGIAQFMPATAKQYKINPRDPKQAIPAAARYLRSSLDTFGGDYRKAIASYNAGVGAVKKYGGIPPFRETQAYVKKILPAGFGASKARTLTTLPIPSLPLPSAGATPSLPLLPMVPIPKLPQMPNVGQWTQSLIDGQWMPPQGLNPDV